MRRGSAKSSGRPGGGGNLVSFFSSGRRHTRYWRDWSSDVCSSDLVVGLALLALVVYPGAVLGVPLVLVDYLAVVRPRVVGGPLGGVLGRPVFLGVPLHLYLVRDAVDVGVDVAVVGYVLLDQDVAVGGVLELHVQVVRRRRRS